jgi:hypothetical protein
VDIRVGNVVDRTDTALKDGWHRITLFLQPDTAAPARDPMGNRVRAL